MKFINTNINKYFHMITLWKSPSKLPVELPVELPATRGWPDPPGPGPRGEGPPGRALPVGSTSEWTALFQPREEIQCRAMAVGAQISRALDSAQC